MLKFVIHSYYLQVSKTKQQLMRKVLLPLILLAFFLPSSTSAQNINLSKDKYDIKLPEGNVHFRFHEQKLTVKFNDGISEEAIQEYLAATGLFQEYSKDWIIPAPLTHRPVLKAGVTYEQAAEVLKQSADVRYVAPVVMYKDEEQSLYDLFYVRVKEDGDLAILRDLAKQFNFAVEGQFPDLKRVYTCRINKSSAGNTFEIEVTVRPAPVGSNMTATVCSDVPVGLDLETDPGSVPAATYTIATNANGLVQSAGTVSAGA